jgi:hypothetical protein
MIRRRTLGGRQAPWPPRRSRQAARAGTPPPRPDYAGPASVTAAFFVAWASVDTVHDTPGSFAARCAPLSTPALERQLAGSQPPTAAWQQMRAARIVSLVQVGRDLPGRRPHPDRVGCVPARLRDLGHRHRLGPHDRQRRRHPPAGRHGRELVATCPSGLAATP